MIYRNAELVLKDGVKRADLLVENGVIKKIAPRGTRRKRTLRRAPRLP